MAWVPMAWVLQWALELTYYYRTLIKRSDLPSTKVPLVYLKKIIVQLKAYLRMCCNLYDAQNDSICKQN